MQVRPQSLTVSSDVLAEIVRPRGKEAVARRGPEPVRWSYRAALLSGFIVAILNAAANASFAATANEGFAFFNFGSANGTLIIGVMLAALWSGARISVLCLIIVHRLLAAMNRTSYWTYVLGGGAVALAYGLIMQTVTGHVPAGGLPLETFSGLGAGLFYRLFAGTQPRDA